jgi:hypothetical protein
MLAHDGCITTKNLVKDTHVGKKTVKPLPHLIANTVDNVAKGIAYAIQTNGEPSLIKPGKGRKLIATTKSKITAFEEIPPEEKESRRLHKGVSMRMRNT